MTVRKDQATRPGPTIYEPIILLQPEPGIQPILQLQLSIEERGKLVAFINAQKTSKHVYFAKLFGLAEVPEYRRGDLGPVAPSSAQLYFNPEKPAFIRQLDPVHFPESEFQDPDIINSLLPKGSLTAEDLAFLRMIYPSISFQELLPSHANQVGTQDFWGYLYETTQRDKTVTLFNPNSQTGILDFTREAAYLRLLDQDRYDTHPLFNAADWQRINQLIGPFRGSWPEYMNLLFYKALLEEPEISISSEGLIDFHRKDVATETSSVLPTIRRSAL